MTNAFRIALALIGVVVLAVVPTALAGKGGGGNGRGPQNSDPSRLSALAPNSPDGLPHFGGEVTFNVSTSASMPEVNLDCYQDGLWVLDDWKGYGSGAFGGQSFKLGPNFYWTGGAADCTARLVEWTSKGTQSTLATTSFHVYA